MENMNGLKLNVLVVDRDKRSVRKCIIDELYDAEKIIFKLSQFDDEKVKMEKRCKDLIKC